MTKNQVSASLQQTVGRLAKLHFLYVLIFVATIVAYDSWKLITPEAVLERWTVAGIMLIVTTALWYTNWTFNLKPMYDKAFIATFILLDICVATFLVYAERGMASRGVALYAVPLVVAAVLKRRDALFAVAALCTAAYSWAAVRYFVVNFNEGLKIELYGTVGLYSAMFFITAALLSMLVQDNK